MDNASLDVLRNGSEEDCLKVLSDFVKKNAQAFKFPDMGIEKKQHLVNEIFRHLRSVNFRIHHICLEAIRILSRDKVGLDELFTQEHLNVMIKLAGLTSDDDNDEEIVFQPELQNIPVIVEAQKCLCNLIYNCKSAQRICSMNGCMEGIMLRLRTYRDLELPHEVKFFDMRMLFLLTALCADVRPKLRNNLHGLIYLMEVLDLILKCNAERLLEQNRNQKSGKKRYSRGSRREKGNKNDAEQYVVPRLTDEEVDLANEVLKVLFNLTVNIDRYNLDEEEDAHCMRLVSILHDIILCETVSSERKDDLISHTVNLLTNMPTASYEELLIPLTDIPGGKSDNKEYEYDGMSMEAVVELLAFMERRLDRQMELKEGLTPVLTCLSESARANRTIRRFLKLKVLPPLKDVMNRPEEGTTLRNRLVKLMTSPMTDLKEIVADFLFVLCKENVARLIKYTGYGNAAGLLANRGLMHGGSGSTGNYSSDSSDSDTEEYRKYRDKINPILGCYEEPRPSPMEGMSEEQKEYEAMQLVNMMDKLARDGILQPMRIGNDGKPHPVDHVLELQNKTRLQTNHSFSGSESD